MPHDAAQAQLVATPFHPQCLMPIVLMGDNRSIKSLIRSALYHRRAVRLAYPLIAIQYSTATPEIYRVLFAWLEDRSSSCDVLMVSFVDASALTDVTTLVLGSNAHRGSSPCRF